MASFPTTVPIEAEPTTGRDSGAPPPAYAGGGDSGLGSPAFADRLRRARLGMGVALSSIAMIFVSFTSAYLVRQGLPTIDLRTGTLVHDWVPVTLPPLLFVNTIVLLLSSVTIELARRQGALAAARPTQATPAPRLSNPISWLALTIVLGFAFLAGQIVAWRELAATGFYLATSPSSSFVYLLTGMHGIHLLGGVLALLFAAAAGSRRTIASQIVIIDATSWYWHFMAALWVYIFCLMKLAH